MSKSQEYFFETEFLDAIRTSYHVTVSVFNGTGSVIGVVRNSPLFGGPHAICVYVTIITGNMT